MATIKARSLFSSLLPLPPFLSHKMAFLLEKGGPRPALVVLFSVPLFRGGTKCCCSSRTKKEGGREKRDRVNDAGGVG